MSKLDQGEVKKSYADICLERASKASPGPWKDDKGTIFTGEGFCFWLDSGLLKYGALDNISDRDERNKARSRIWNELRENSYFTVEARTMVPELARRLNLACDWLENSTLNESDYVKRETKTFIETLKVMPRFEIDASGIHSKNIRVEGKMNDKKVDTLYCWLSVDRVSGDEKIVAVTLPNTMTLQTVSSEMKTMEMSKSL